MAPSLNKKENKKVLVEKKDNRGKNMRFSVIHNKVSLTTLFSR